MQTSKLIIIAISAVMASAIPIGPSGTEPTYAKNGTALIVVPEAYLETIVDFLKSQNRSVVYVQKNGQPIKAGADQIQNKSFESVWNVISPVLTTIGSVVAAFI